MIFNYLSIISSDISIILIFQINLITLSKFIHAFIAHSGKVPKCKS